MTKFLFTTLPSNDLGLLTRSLPIARELGSRGHQITFCNPGQSPQKVITDAGFENFLPDSPLYYLIAGDVSPQNILRFLAGKNRLANLKRLTASVRALFTHSTTEIRNVDHFMSLLGMLDADFIRINLEILLEIITATRAEAVIDFWNPLACLAAKISGIPLITVIQADLHPQSKGFIWWSPPAAAKYPHPAPVVNTVLKKYGQPAIDTVAELLLGELTLVVGMPETDPLPPEADVHYVGPLLWEKPAAELPSWITARNTDRPLVWVYTGNPCYLKGASTAFDSRVVFQACRKALGHQPLQVVLTTGYHKLPRKFLSLPPNFHLEPFLPGLAMAEKSDLIIHHGGYGSCQTGLYTGTPALIIPTYSERESNARRIAEQGAGDFIVPETDRKGRKKYVAPEVVREKTKAILAEPAFTDNARQLRKKLQTYEGAQGAARLIETHLGKQAG